MDVAFAQNTLAFLKQSTAIIAAQQQRIEALQAELTKVAADRTSAAALSKQVADQLIAANRVPEHLRALTEVKLASHLGALEAYSTLLGNMAAESTGTPVPNKQASAGNSGNAPADPNAKSNAVWNNMLLHRRRAS